MNIYVVEKPISIKINEQAFPQKEWERLLSYKNEERRNDSAACYLLLRYALKTEFGIDAKPELLYGSHGKPFIDGFQFSYSHCKTAIACVVSLEECGVDIQDYREVKPSVREKILCADEIAADIDFFEAWVKKEAIAKLTGDGYANGFRVIDTLSDKRAAAIKRERYAVASACCGGVGAINVVDVSARDLKQII